MDPLFFSSPFNTPIANLDNWGNVTDNFGTSLGSINRYGSFQSNLSPFSYNVDSYGTISTGLNGLGTPLYKLNNYNDYLSNQHRRDAMDFLQQKDFNDRHFQSYESPFDKIHIQLPVIEPIIIKYPKIKYNNFDFPDI